MNRMLRSLVFAIGCSALAGLGAFAQNPKISRDLATADPSSTVPVIIQYAQDPGANEDAAVANVGGNVRFHMHTIHSHAVLVPQYKLAQLASNPDVSIFRWTGPSRHGSRLRSRPPTIRLSRSTRRHCGNRDTPDPALEWP